MKFSDIIKTFKKSANIQIYGDQQKTDGTQWLSNAVAAYALENMPRFTSETLPAAASLAWSAEQIKEIPFPAGYNFADCDEAENFIERSPIQLGGFAFFFTQDGLTVIDAKYLIPFRNEYPDDLSFYERVSENGDLYIAVKRGMIIIAVISPLASAEGVIESHKDDVRELLGAMEAYKTKRSEERRERFYNSFDDGSEAKE